MNKIRVAINGFGRIGRNYFKQAFDKEELEVVAFNDLGDLENMAYLLKYDTVYGRYNKNVKCEAVNIKVGKVEAVGKLIVDGKEILMFQQKDPRFLPWKDLDIDVVIESTGFFTDYAGAALHLEAGAKRVVISAPAKGDIEHILIGTNDDKFKPDLSKITSDASCTTNAVTPLLAIMSENPGIVKAMMSTVHGYTATQSLVDGPGKKGDFLRGRAAAQNIVPSHTGAADAVIKSMPGLNGIFDAIALRVPVITGSLVDLTFIAKRQVSVEEINNILKEAASNPRWKNVIKIVEEPIVSSDIIGEPYPAIIDLTLTKVTAGDMVKIFSWYDNEWGYTASLIEHSIRVGKFEKEG